MDAPRFDALVQRLTLGHSRRGVLRLALGGASATALATLAPARVLAGKPCVTHLDCPKKQVCSGTNRKGESVCVASSCPADTVAVCKATEADFAICCQPDRPICCQGQAESTCCPDGSACDPFGGPFPGYAGCVPPA